MNDSGLVDGIHDVTRSDVWINGGYFVFRTRVLDDLGPARSSSRSRSTA